MGNQWEEVSTDSANTPPQINSSDSTPASQKWEGSNEWEEVSSNQTTNPTIQTKAEPPSWYQNLWAGVKTFGTDLAPNLKDLGASIAKQTIDTNMPTYSQKDQAMLQGYSNQNAQDSAAAQAQVAANHAANKDALDTVAGKIGYGAAALIPSVLTRGEMVPQMLTAGVTGALMPVATGESRLGNAAGGAIGAGVGVKAGQLLGKGANLFVNEMGPKALEMFQTLQKEGLTGILDSAQATGNSVAHGIRSGLNAVTNAGENFYKSTQAPAITEAILRKFTATDLPDVAANLAKTGKPLSDASPEVLGAIKLGAQTTRRKILGQTQTSLLDNTPVYNLTDIDPLHYDPNSTGNGIPGTLQDCLTALKATVRRKGFGDKSDNPIVSAINQLEASAVRNNGVIPPSTLAGIRDQVSDLYAAGGLTRELGGKLGDVLDSAIMKQGAKTGVDADNYWKAQRTLQLLHPIERAITNVNDRVLGGKDIIDPTKLYSVMDAARNTERSTTGGFSTLEEQRLYNLSEALQHFVGDRPNQGLRAALTTAAGRIGAGTALGAAAGAAYSGDFKGAGAGGIIGGMGALPLGYLISKGLLKGANGAIYGDTLRPILTAMGNSPGYGTFTNQILPRTGAAIGADIGMKKSSQVPDYLSKAFNK